MMEPQQADEMDAIATVSRLIAQLGLEGLIAVVEVTEQQSDYLLMAGEHQKAAQVRRKARTLQRAAQTLGT
jgi:hypothetical protein